MNGVEINFANAQVQPWTNGVSIYLAIKGAGSISVCSGLIFTQYQEGEAVTTAESLKLSRPAAQVLLDSLYRAGVRPSQAASEDSERKAMSEHLQDMRQIAFKTLDVEKP